ncbi:tetratricopeptide repeat protein [Candidatus Albibeggiatoa sp. nov. BB20]|uniref:tetratricopeptide repeat protein n=1 Tax=Candidatus Albibeggiatoa sp. nov. BB20 TaxID=3162723 RepID=UPI0033658968
MDKTINLPSDDNLKQKIDEFADKLQIIEPLFDKKEEVQTNRLVELLLLRTKIEELLLIHCQQCQLSEESWEPIQRLDALDVRLQNMGEMIAQNIDLAKWQTRADIEQQYWWWFFKPPMDIWDKYDWVWTGLTVVVLALSASFVFSIYSALSIGTGSQIFTTFSTVLQGLGLALIGGGALSTIGQNKVREILTYFHISPKLHAETIFAVSIIFLLFTFALHSYLDDFYFEQGQKLYEQGELASAAEAYEKTLAIDPDNDKINGELGRIYESLGNLEKAVQYYMASVNDGNYEHLNGLGRVYINRLNPISRKPDIDLATGYLLIGLQRAEGERDVLKQFIDFRNNKIEMSEQEVSGLVEMLNHFGLDAKDAIEKIESRLSKIYGLLYKYHENIGWAILSEQEVNYKAAQKQLQKAIKYEKQATALAQKINVDRKPNGLAYCMLAYLRETQSATEQTEQLKASSLELWDQCVCKADPEYIYSFRWFFQINKGDIAYKVDSSYVVSGMNKENTDFYQQCKQDENTQQTAETIGTDKPAIE